MKEYLFWQVDAFSGAPYLGNPAAIVLEADALREEQMQTVARQFNLSETVFLCRPRSGDADYRARIFTPKRELPMAGHPTIAASFSFLKTGKPSRLPRTLRQECGIGVVPIEVREDDSQPLFTITMGAPESRASGLTAASVASLIGCDVAHITEAPAEVCSTGLPWLIASVRSLSALQSAKPDHAAIEATCHGLEAIGITVYCRAAELESCDVHVRTFAPGVGILEDPVCGSGNAALAFHMARHVFPTTESFSFRAEQGLEIGRRGILHLNVDGNGGKNPSVRLGGRAVRVMHGSLGV